MAPSRFRRLARAFLAAACAACAAQAAPVQSVYDDGGRLRFWMDANGAAASPQRIGYQRHDSRGRVVEEGLVQGRFDPALLGRLAALPGEPSDTARTWRRRFFYADDLGGGADRHPGALLAVHTRDTQGAVHEQSFRYDALGRVTVVTESLGDGEPAMRTRYHRDAHGLVVRIDGPAPVDEADPDGLLLRYDGQGRVRAIGRHRRGAFEPEHYALYTWSADGRLLAEVRNPHSAAGRVLLRYAHDAQGRLTSVRAWVGGRAAYAQTLRYDDRLIRAMRQDYLLEPSGPRSLRWQRGDTGLGEHTVLTVDPHGERVLQLQDGRSMHAYAYDRNGNVLRKTGHLEQLAVDTFLDLPVAVDTTDQKTMQMRYGGLQAERVMQSSEWGPEQARQRMTQAYYRGLEAYPLMIIGTTQAEDGTAPARRSRQRPVWGPGGLVAVADEGATGGAEERYVIGNHQGSTVMVLDGRGRPMASYAYTAAGRISDAAGRALQGPPLVPYLFQGQEYDWTTGLHNFRARLYDSDALRFLAPDPVVVAGQPAYLAMNGDPVNWVDPDGRMMVQVSDFRQRARGHVMGMAFSLAMTGTTLGLYGAYAGLGAAAFPLASGLFAVTGGVYAVYGLYRVVQSSSKEFWQLVNAGGTLFAADQVELTLLSQSPGLRERGVNATAELAVVLTQIGGGKMAVAFNTPFRSNDYRVDARYGPSRAFTIAWVTNTLAMQPVNGAVLYVKKVAGRTSPDVPEWEQLMFMGIHDVAGNGCYYACAAWRTLTPGVLGRPRRSEYRMKGCLWAYMGCRAVTRGTESVWTSAPMEEGSVLSAAVPPMLLGAAVDYSIGTHLMGKMPIDRWYEYLTTGEVATCLDCCCEVTGVVFGCCLGNE